jgi:hypothetical protein
MITRSDNMLKKVLSNASNALGRCTQLQPNRADTGHRTFTFTIGGSEVRSLPMVLVILACVSIVQELVCSSSIQCCCTAGCSCISHIGVPYHSHQSKIRIFKPSTIPSGVTYSEDRDKLLSLPKNVERTEQGSS